MKRKSEPIRVYIADVEALAEPAKYQAAYEKASAERKKKIDRFRFPAGKRLSLGAGLLLQQALEREGISDIEIGLMPGGKPYLKKPKGWFFNLSHSGTQVMCVLAREPVGCDIERKKKNSFELVAKKAFSPQEQEGLLYLDGEAQQQYFYRLWTGKESYLKLTGEGLRRMPVDFTIAVPFGRQRIGNRQVVFYEISCGEEYQGTVCREVPGGEDVQIATAVASQAEGENTQGELPIEELRVEYIEF